MNKLRFLLTTSVTLLMSIFAIGVKSALSDEGLVRTEWPTDNDPGMPFYARVENLPPYIFNDGEWAAIIFYRDPEFVPGEFNLLTVFDVPRAFSRESTVTGSSLWHDRPFNGAPKIIHITGGGNVPIWFVPWDSVRDQARADGVLSVNDLLAIEGRLVGYANHFAETLHPHPDPAFGGGGHPNPKMIVDASGQLEDGRAFRLHINWVHDEVKAIKIQFD